MLVLKPLHCVFFKSEKDLRAKVDRLMDVTQNICVIHSGYLDCLCFALLSQSFLYLFIYLFIVLPQMCRAQSGAGCPIGGFTLDRASERHV